MRTERKGAALFEDKWSNAKAAKVAAMIAKGYSYRAIAAELNDGTTFNAIGSTASEWGLAPKAEKHTHAIVPVPLSGIHRTQLAEEARRRGMEMPELVAHVVVTMCRDGLYSAILDG